MMFDLYFGGAGIERTYCLFSDLSVRAVFKPY